MEKATNEYIRWLNNSDNDFDLYYRLLSMKDNPDEIAESFYKELTFGTSGIRGILGPGTNRINKYVVKRATLGLADYLVDNFKEPKVIIAYDSRKKSHEFAYITARILSGREIKVYLFDEITPVSVLSFGICKLKCSAGVMITASHNPKIFNGYKVYNDKGYQVVGSVPDEILGHINEHDYFEEAKTSDENIEILDDSIKNMFIEKVTSMMPKVDEDLLNKDISIVYTPLNGAGNLYVKSIFKNLGFTNILTVPAQDFPDENFTTCPVPNPEKIAAYQEAFKTLTKKKADIVIATDPDSDRTGAAIVHNGMKTSLSGNQIGILMLDFLCKFREIKPGQFVMKSIVSTPLAEEIAKRNGLETINTLTGFKYIGEKIEELAEEGLEDKYFFGFEESNGFLMNPFILDKDGVSSAVLIGLMAAYYHKEGIDLLDRLDEIYKEHKPCVDRTKNFVFEGIEGAKTMENIMDYLRNDESGKIGEAKIVKKRDYKEGLDGLPPSNVLEFFFEDGTKALIRPSGTEPKIKVYLFLPTNISKADREITALMNSFN